MDTAKDRDLELLFRNGILLKYKKGETIIRAEEDLLGIFYLKTGYIKLYNLSVDGREQIISIFKPGSYFPIAWVLAGVKNFSYYEALTPVKVAKVSSKKVVEFLDNNPGSLRLLVRRLSSGLNGLTKLINILFLATARQKVAYILVQLAGRFGEPLDGGNIKITLPVTHQLISNYAGLVRETVSLEMDKLREEKLIDYSRSHLTIINLSKLKEISQLASDQGGQSEQSIIQAI